MPTSSAEPTEPLLSVCIPVFQGAASIERCIRSALESGVDDLEVIVGDDASTDATCEIVASIDDERVRLLRAEKNIGRAQNINRVFGEARGRFTLLLAADCQVPVGGLASRIAVMSGDDTIDVCFGGLERRYPDTGEVRTMLPFAEPWQASGAQAVARLLPTDPIYTVAAVLRTSAVRRVDGLRIEIAPSHRDWDFFLRIGATSAIAYVPEISAIETDHPLNFTTIATREGRMGFFEFQILDAFTRWAEHAAPDVLGAVRTGRRAWAHSALAHSLLARAGRSPRDARTEFGLALMADERIKRNPRFYVALLALFMPRPLMRAIGGLLERVRASDTAA